MQLSPPTARHWVDRWDRQQEGYLPDRETMFAVIADAVAETVRDAGRSAPIVIDLACGPGSLGARIREHLPQARVIGVDTDPVLLALARAVYGFEVVDHDLTDAGWVAALPLRVGAEAEQVDAIVSTTALHWLHSDQLAALYAQAGALLRPVGILLNGDGMAGPTAEIERIDRAIDRGQVERSGVADREEWADWWTAIKQEPELADVLAERDGRAWQHPENGGTTYEQHVELLREAGFRAVEPVWQYGRRRILAAVK
jgi:SAM-dependent methyltransferase